MWAQLSTVRVSEGRADVVRRAMEQLQAFEQPDSGLLHTSLADALQAAPEYIDLELIADLEPSVRAR